MEVQWLYDNINYDKSISIKKGLEPYIKDINSIISNYKQLNEANANLDIVIGNSETQVLNSSSSGSHALAESTYDIGVYKAKSSTQHVNVIFLNSDVIEKDKYLPCIVFALASILIIDYLKYLPLSSLDEISTMISNSLFFYIAMYLSQALSKERVAKMIEECMLRVEFIVHSLEHKDKDFAHLMLSLGALASAGDNIALDSNSSQIYFGNVIALFNNIKDTFSKVIERQLVDDCTYMSLLFQANAVKIFTDNFLITGGK